MEESMKPKEREGSSLRLRSHKEERMKPKGMMPTPKEERWSLRKEMMPKPNKNVGKCRISKLT
jgi:hypothetical protein